jgi:hypothetical protein
MDISFSLWIFLMASAKTILFCYLDSLKDGGVTVMLLNILLYIIPGITEAITDKITNHFCPQYQGEIYAGTDDTRGQTEHPQTSEKQLR